MAEKFDEEAEADFHRDIDETKLEFPGTATETVFLNEHQRLIAMLNKEYSDWNKHGTVTFVPKVRISPSFCRGDEMSKNTERPRHVNKENFFVLQKLCNLFTQKGFLEHPGLIIFPNFDTTGIFHSTAAKVEIDMVLIDQMKGVFTFHVDNSENSGFLWSEKLMMKIRKSNRFMKLLLTYRSDQDKSDVPIYNVLCTSQTNVDESKKCENNTGNNFESIIVFSDRDLKPSGFYQTWIEKTKECSRETAISESALQTLVARLVVLNSNQQNDFYKELDDFDFLLPGSGSDVVHCHENDAFLKMTRSVYFDWKESGKMTSVPAARIPSLFLHNLAMCKELQKNLKGYFLLPYPAPSNF